MKNIKAVLLLFTLLSSNLVSAQNNSIIKGRVIDQSENFPMIGATVAEYNSDNRVVNGTVTNVDGDFILELNSSSNIVKVSMIGYESKELDLDFTKSMVIYLEPTSVELEAATITAESKSFNNLTNIDDRDKASSSVKIDLADMRDAAVVSAADALQGRVTGLDIISASGDPGSGSQLVIRGLSSMGNNKPLIVIDGIPQFRVSDNFDLSAADQEDISNLINIAVQDIKSIEVLKDAASTAIYGSRGADGVLLIETRQGRMGKVQFDYQYKSSLTIQPDPIPMLNGDEFIMLQLEELHNNNPVFEVPSELAYDRTHPEFYNYSANTDWISQLTQNGKVDDHYFSISGGGSKTRFFTSVSYIDEGGTTINTSSKRFSTRTNLTYFISKDILFQIKFNYSINNREQNYKFGGYNEFNDNWDGVNIREMAYVKAPNMSIWEYDRFGKPTGEYFTPIESYQGDGIAYFNPVAVAHQGTRDTKNDKIENSFMLQYRVKDWLIVRETVTFQNEGWKKNEFLPYTAVGADWLNNYNNRAKEENNQSNSLRTETQVAFTSPFENEIHDISGAFTWVTNNSGYEEMKFTSGNGPSVDIEDPAINAHVINLENKLDESRMLSGVGNVNYKYRDKYLFQFNLRADGYSSFGESNRWGLFKGISVGWRFSEEPFLKNIDFLGESKLRYSWGVSGRQPNDTYARFARYQTSNRGSYLLNPAIEPKSVQLTNLRWENITSNNFGLELNLFNDRVYFEGDIYEKVTSDILFQWYSIPNLSGYGQYRYFNGGELRNEGWEIMFDAKLVRTEDVLLSVNFNVSQNNNIFSELPENYDTERATAIANGEFPKKIEEGAPIGSFFGFRYLGVFPSDEDALAKDANGNIMYDSEGNPMPLTYKGAYIFKGGDPIYEDINNDGIINLNDAVEIGNSNPKYIGGFGTRAQYKNFDFYAGFHYRIGFDIVNGVAIQTQGMNDRNNQSKAVLRRWRTQGEDEEHMLPRAYMDHPANNLGSDRYVEKGDYLRLNNVKLSYNLRKDIANRLGLRSLIISLSARKLYTFTQYSGQDPEVGQNASDPFWIGVDEANTPPPKMYTATIRIGF